MNRIEKLKQLKNLMDNHDKYFGRQNTSFCLHTWTSKTECGTSACALGSAAQHKPFMKRGLHLVNKEGYYTTREEPYFQGDYGMDAGKEFFEITLEESLWLFDPDAYFTSDIKLEHVSHRINTLIEHYSENAQPFIKVDDIEYGEDLPEWAIDYGSEYE